MLCLATMQWCRGKKTRKGHRHKGKRMKVLKDNYRETVEEIKRLKAEPYPRKLLCEKCESELEYDKSDKETGVYGLYYIKCPLCKHDNYLDEGEDITVENIEFPTHFGHTSDESAVDCFNNETIKEYIREGIAFLRKNKDEFDWFVRTGNLHLRVHKYSGDEQYEIMTTKDFYDSYIPFEAEDY